MKKIALEAGGKVFSLNSEKEEKLLISLYSSYLVYKEMEVPPLKIALEAG